MRVLNKDLYHGAALSKILESNGCTSIRKASPMFGHYEVNGGRRVFIRHSTSASSPWHFSFRPRDLRSLQNDMDAGRKVFVCMVCGKNTICVLTADQFRQVVSLTADEAQSIRIHARARTSIQVSGSAGELAEKVPKHAFPSRLFR